MRVSKSALVVLSALALLTACQKEPEPTPPPQAQEQAPNPNPAPPAPTPTPASNPSLIREPAAPPASKPPTLALPYPFARDDDPQPQAGRSSSADYKVKVVGQILNVEFMFIPAKNENGGYRYTSARTGKVADFAYIDESTSKRISLLQDENGKYMVDPSPSDKDISVSGSSPRIIALKFPAPPETSPTITIDFPGAGSFDSVPVGR